MDPAEVRISMAYTNQSAINSGRGPEHNNPQTQDKTGYQKIVASDQEGFISLPRTRNFGSHIPFCVIGKDPFFTIGPDWQYFLCMWSFMLIAGVLVNVYVAVYLPVEIRMLTQIVTLFQLLVYLLTSLRNPGIASKAANEMDPNQIDNDTNPSFCKKCRVLRSNEVYHCVDCDVCIQGFDHHCPWTGKCVGEGNLRLFYTFLASTMIYIVYLIIITCVVTATLSANFKP